MIVIREATEAEFTNWQDDWRSRLEVWYSTADVTADWISAQVKNRMAVRRRAAESATLALTSGDAAIGMLAMSLVAEDGIRNAIINDIWIAEPYRRKGHGTEALRQAEQWARARDAVSMWAVTDPGEPAHAALFAAYPVRAHQMIRNVASPGQLADGLVGRQMTEAEFADWRAESVRGYAADILNSGTLPAEQAAVSAAAQFDQLLPDGLTTAGHSFLCLCAGAEVVATNWLGHHRNPGVSWVYGVEVHEQYRGKGYGRAAMVIGERATLEAGDTYLALNVFGHNHVAISMYEAMDYRAYDHGRSIEL